MKRKVCRLLKGFPVLCLVIVNQLHGSDMIIAAGAGYKKPVSEIVDTFRSGTGLKVDALFGNLHAVASQARQSDEVAIIIGDARLLEKLGSIITCSGYVTLGKGVLVLACRKGLTVNDPKALLSKTVTSVFMPQAGKAIYGVAAREVFESYGFDQQITDKVTEVATVPLVVSYLVAGEADAGFINLTEALANNDKFGGYVMVSQDHYKRIDIVAGRVEGFSDTASVNLFLQFLQSDTAKAIYVKYGI